MSNVLKKLARAYFAVPLLLMLVVILATIGASMNLRHFSYDASADTLVAENDEALAYFRKVSKNFGEENFLFLTYEPLSGSLLDRENLDHLAELQDRLLEIDGVTGVTSILDVPLLKSPPIKFQRMATDFKTLRMADVDIALAQKELFESPLFQELLISNDKKATALRVNLKSATELEGLRMMRDALRLKEGKTAEEEAALAVIEEEFTSDRRAYVADQERLMTDIRAVRAQMSDKALIYMAGVPMVASDMIRYVKNDVSTFGGVILLVVMVVLLAFFRQLRWVFIPLITSLLAVVITSGLLGYLRQPVTVISANFVPLLIIFSISISVHIIVRFKELTSEQAHGDVKQTFKEAMIDKFRPSFYTALTTIAAFASLTFSGIVPVDDFGKIMCISMLVALVLNYTFLPAVVSLLPASKPKALSDKRPVLTSVMREASLRMPVFITGVTVLVFAGAVLGMSNLSTDSRFIDYFRDSSDIKQGLIYTDKNLGGTTPMEIIVTFPPFVHEPVDDEDDFFEEEPDAYPERYWYTPDKIDKLRQLEAFLKEQSEVGKIISLATLEAVAQGFNEDKPLNTVQLAGVVGALPDNLREEFLLPYSTPSEGLMRISLRMRETAPRSSRDALIEGIEKHAIEELGFAEGEVRVTGMNVLFNNMLKMLIQSQVSTIGLVILATFLMLFVLLRSGLLAVVGLLPNLLSASMILGVMGFMGITLDMMTITIAAVVVGIGVDNAIHYLFRFKQEIAEGQDVQGAIEASHNSIGFALYYTAFTIIAGFAVLSFSNFIPTVYFGTLTALAMGFSLIVNLVVLPSLLMVLFPKRQQA